MNDRHLSFNHSLEKRKSDLIYRLFLAPADEDYICARWAFQSGIFISSLVLSAQAVEKYLKAALLHLDHDVRPYRHDILRMWSDLVQYDTVGNLPRKLRWPKTKPDKKLRFKGRKISEFMDYLAIYGSPDNRYGSYGTNVDGSIIFSLDFICYSLRNFIRQNSVLSNDLFEMNSEDAYFDDRISKPCPWMIGPTYLLERLHAEKTIQVGESKSLRNVFKNMNLAFAPDYESTEGSFGGIHFMGSPIHNWLVRHKEIDPSKENAKIANKLKEWVYSRIPVNRNVKEKLGL